MEIGNWKQAALNEDLCSKGVKDILWRGQVFSTYQECPNTVLGFN